MFGNKKQELISDGLGDVNSIVELSLLDARAGERDTINFCNIAYKNRYAAIVVFPQNVKIAKTHIAQKLDGALKVVAAIDFPFGGMSAAAKIAEAKRCFSEGADEVDVTISASDVAEEKYSAIKTLVSRIVRSSRGKVVKACIEMSYLNREQLGRLLRVLCKTRVDYIMTNTGFGTGGAIPDQVEIMTSIVGTRCGIKAAGGVTNRVIATDLMRAGATRIGTSHII